MRHLNLTTRVSGPLLCVLAGLLIGCASEPDFASSANGAAGSDGSPGSSAANESPAPAGTGLYLPPGEPVPDEVARAIMYDLIGTDSDRARAARETIVRVADTRFVAVFLELMWARRLGIVGGVFEDYVDALETLSGQAIGTDWRAWVEWYGQSGLLAPPGFTGWKGRLLGSLDSGFRTFLADGLPSRIRTEEILWGGVRVDGIPPLDHAPMIRAADATYLLDEEPVFGIEVNGDARAYPLRIIDNHEMANDTVGGVPISLAYCTLCGAAIAFDGRASNGETYSFGTSGLLYRSNKLMYDRTTRTLWNQLTGTPVLGELANTDVRLDIVPTVLSAWGDWREQHPDTLVLSRQTGAYPPEFYEPGVLYGGYFSSADTMFPVWLRSDDMADKAFVYTLFLDGVPKAYDVATLADRKVVNDTVGNTGVVLVATRGVSRMAGEDMRAGSVSYTNGGEVRAFGRGDLQFQAGSEPYTLTDESGGSWTVTEQALVSDDGQSRPRLPGHLAYWFGWYAFFPDTLLYPAAAQ